MIKDNQCLCRRPPRKIDAGASEDGPKARPLARTEAVLRPHVSGEAMNVPLLGPAVAFEAGNTVRPEGIPAVPTVTPFVALQVMTLFSKLCMLVAL